mmetsp:Transcript_7322/g.13547  ORF Transcript_7322/g.13547 Transcript_7322/m.13547 type:complete len:147 (+) Transcript_7322:247-687(+)
MADLPNLSQVYDFLTKSGSLEPQNLDLTLRYFNVPFMSSNRLSVEEREQCCVELLRLVTKSNDVRVSLPQFTEAVKSYIVFKRLADAVAASLRNKASTELDLSKIYPDASEESTQDTISQDCKLMRRSRWSDLKQFKFVRLFLCLR